MLVYQELVYQESRRTVEGEILSRRDIIKERPEEDTDGFERARCGASLRRSQPSAPRELPAPLRESPKLLETGRAAHVPVLLGSNLNEGSTFITGHIGDERDFEEYFNKTFGETSGKAIAEFYKPSSTPSSDPYEAHEIYNKAAQDAAGDFDLRCPTMMAARTFASLGQPTYLYSFDHQPFESVNCEFLPCAARLSPLRGRDKRNARRGGDPPPRSFPRLGGSLRVV